MSDPLRLGLYICHCGLNIAGVLRPGTLAAAGQRLLGVVISRHQLYSCSEAGQREILEDIAAHGLNRVVIAACSPKMHELTFRRLLAEAGLNPYFLEIVNLREQCSWVHAQDPEAAAAKALDLIRMGVAKVLLAQPLFERQVPVTKRALVIGGGLAGLRTALDIAEAGHEVILVEKQPYLGGWANRLHRTFPHGQKAFTVVNPIMAAVSLHPRIHVLLASEVTGVAGHLGSYQVEVTQQPQYVSAACDACGRCQEVCTEATGGRPAISLPVASAFPGRYVIDPAACTCCGACVAACPQQAIQLAAQPPQHFFQVGTLVVATGFTPFNPRGSRYEAWARLPGVLTSLALEERLAHLEQQPGTPLTPAGEPQDIAFVLCVGSREATGNRYCSRVCCPTALKQALELQSRAPKARIRIYYRDMRTVRREWEALYTKARQAGILFLRGPVQDIRPEGGRLHLTAINEIFQVPSEDVVDLVILMVGLTPGEGQPLRDTLKLPVGEDGFFLEAHPKLRPLDTVLDGIFLAGACQGPKDMAATMAQASGAAAKVMGLLAHDSLTLDGIICEIDPEKCTGCQRCVRQCPFQAVELVTRDDKSVAQVIVSACKGCGVCAGACPAGAVIAHGFTDEMLLAQIDAALAESPQEKILAFACNWCSYAGADFAGVSRLQYPPHVRLIRTMCAGRVHPKLVEYALAKGAGLVLVSGCRLPSDCHYLRGNIQAKARMEKLRTKLAAQGINPERLQTAWLSATEGRAFQQLMLTLTEKLARLQAEMAIQGAGMPEERSGNGHEA
ncbi:MAG: FAD-dependent oxidoreductase [Desulfobacca sp.]|uniref:FAD-dependent oxidoreductase n=1 Tax=Desulfobacca sp. TaxID=2067990 RepID=UPI00404B81B9